MRISVNEAAELIGLSQPSVYRLIQQKKLRFYQPTPGGKIFIEKQDVEEFIRDRTFSNLQNKVHS